MDNQVSKTTMASAVKQKASSNYLRMAPRKIRLEAGLIRGLSVNEAEAQLLFQKRRGAKPLLKLLRSAKANAVKSAKLDPEKLFVEAIQVDGGPMIKRFLPRARGMATPIQKKTSHVKIVLAEKPALTSARFAIVAAKKEKKVVEGPKKGKKVQERKPSEEFLRRREPGFFRRIFRRKSV